MIECTNEKKQINVIYSMFGVHNHNPESPYVTIFSAAMLVLLFLSVLIPAEVLKPFQD